MNLTAAQRARAEAADLESPWTDEWVVVLADSDTGQVLCTARNRVELVERAPAPDADTTWTLTFKRI